ncbi:MAG TPA: hypothetical protein VN783_10850 [Thermoanaerobaculia bacterium]|nr:hypothetical protein [Thermoanaerobaculia bacterium]
MNPAPRRLNSLALFGALACALLFSPARSSAQYSEDFGKNKITYKRFEWRIYHSPHFNLYYYPDEEAKLEKVASFAESAYDSLSRAFNFQIKEPIPLIFYATHSAFEQNNIIQNFIPEGVGAFASPARFRMVLPIDLSDLELMQLIRHELTHIFQYQILFQGRLAEAAATSPPTWFMEGMASYMAKDESARDKMYLRDAVVNDQIPSINDDVEGFFAYRFGHALFDFVEDRWGKDGFLDFVYETRNSLGSRVDRAVKRTFKLDIEDFDAEFRRWLRKKYLPQLVATGEPGDFGRLFRIESRSRTYETSPTASPSGDLVASFSAYRGDVDVVLFDARKRRLLRNLTKGYTSQYQYPVAQELELGRKTGRDLAFSPDGNTIALFVKRESGRSLALLDVLKGGIRRIIEMKDIEQQLSPAWSPDGKRIVFSGLKGGQYDIYSIDLDSFEVTNLTNDAVFDGAPTYSPDGRSIIFVSSIGDGARKLFRIDLDKPSDRYQITSGPSNENDPIYSADGKRLYFTSDRDGGADNIFSLDLATGTLLQHTNVVTGASMPTLLKRENGKEALVYTGFWKGTFDLYLSDLEEKIGTPATEPIATTPTNAQAIPGFEPDIQVAIDDANKERYGRKKFFLEGAQTFVGVDDNQTVVGQVYLSFSDYLGDKRIAAQFASVESLSNFDVSYQDLSRRWPWQVNLFDYRLFFASNQIINGEFGRGDSALQETGLVGSVAYPISFYDRAEFGLGFVVRDIKFQSFIFDNRTGQTIQTIFPRKDNFPLLQSAFVSDTTVFNSAGPVSGHRLRLEGNYAPDTKDSGTLFTQVQLDARQYFAFTPRSGLALRAWGAAVGGHAPTPLAIGGLDTLRGVDFRTLLGDRAFFANVELRFPLIDLIATPFLGLQGIRGILFLDAGGAWFHDFQSFQFYNSKTSKLQDGIAAYGYGISARIFGGLDFNWDFAKRYRAANGDDGFHTSFWIGTRF